MTNNIFEQRAAGISLRQLRLFSAIGTQQSVRRASEECSLSQPAVTQSLAKLEQQVGVSLVDRRASGSYLNAAGKLLHQRVQRFFAQMSAAITECDPATSPATAQAIVNRLTRPQLRTLTAAIEHGPFERASDALAISVSSLQRAARDLENNLHIALFHRTAAGILVTPTGIRLGRRIKLALKEVEVALEEIAAAQGLDSLQVVVGAMPFGGSVLLASALDDFLARQPNADIRIINDSAPEMKKSLRDGEVDLVIGLLPEQQEEELNHLALAATPYSVVVRRGHPLTAQGRVSLADLTAFDWVVGTPGSSRRACFDHLFAGRDGPKAQIATCALTVLQHLLKQSNRLTLMTSYELEHGGDALRALPLDPILPVPSIGILTRRDWMPTALHADFIDVVRRHVAKKSPALRQVG